MFVRVYVYHLACLQSKECFHGGSLKIELHIYLVSGHLFTEQVVTVFWMYHVCICEDMSCLHKTLFVIVVVNWACYGWLEVFNIDHVRFATLSDIKQYIVRHLEEQNEAISKASWS